MKFTTSYAAPFLALCLSTVHAKAIPSNIQAFRNRIVSGASNASAPVGGPFCVEDGCTDRQVYYRRDAASKVLYLRGSGSNLSDMDVDCDGNRASGEANDGRCGQDSSPGNQDITAFQYQVSQYGIKDLDPYIHSYVVFGNDGTSPAFKPETFGIEPLSVMAVVCGDQLIYGIWGDTNGDQPPAVGEASLAMATACFGDSMNWNNGHGQQDVLYIAFPGKDAVPGTSANWAASDFDEFEASISSLGDKLIQTITH